MTSEPLARQQVWAMFALMPYSLADDDNGKRLLRNLGKVEEVCTRRGLVEGDGGMVGNGTEPTDYQVEWGFTTEGWARTVGCIALNYGAREVSVYPMDCITWEDGTLELVNPGEEA